MGEWLRSPIRGVLLDITGVLYESSADHGTVIPGSVKAVNRLRESGMPFRLVTNETTTPTTVLLDKLRRFGYQLEERELFSPIPAVVKLLQQEQLVPHLLVHPKVEGELRVGEKGSPASCVVLGDAEDNFSYANLNSAFRALMVMPCPRLITLGYGRYYKHNQQLQLDVGVYAKALEFACGVESEVVGKPSPAFFNQALADMGVQAEEAVMVGDDISSDVEGAQKCGMRGVLVRTGKFTSSLLPHPTITPDCVVDNLAEAVDQILAAKGKN
ncbi:hypothetical protein Pmani_032178 [Petrolisthes manimaculis]|uniref:Phospholysine phosphohistidine inorganic pyrophosphate phosphatase n=1 Tax=Petrolisthes manimaculis TaxID=1843537 RepID=A0AAE1TU16_9EUCA|nr:hypothetical protein Pmani_032178 [Petrolisthes manimaculis]